MIAQHWDKLPSPPTLPGKWSGFLDRKGPLTSIQGYRRRVRRFHFCQKAILQRDGKNYAIWTKAVSRNGISFISGFQLFSCDQIKLWLPEGPHPELIVTRFLRHAKKLLLLRIVVCPGCCANTDRESGTWGCYIVNGHTKLVTRFELLGALS